MPASAAARRRPWSGGSSASRFGRARAGATLKTRRHGRDAPGSCRSRARGCSRRPAASHHSSSVVSQPMPWMKPPSIWPRSIAGFSERPTSWRMSARSDPVFAGQRVDRHFAARPRRRRNSRTGGPVPVGAVPVDLGRRVEAGRAESWHARHIGRADQLGERDLRLPTRTRSGSEDDLVGRHRRSARRRRRSAGP